MQQVLKHRQTTPRRPQLQIFCRALVLYAETDLLSKVKGNP